MYLSAVVFVCSLTVFAAVNEAATVVDRHDDLDIVQLFIDGGSGDGSSGDGSGFRISDETLPLEGSGTVPWQTNKNFTVKTRTAVEPRKSLERHKTESDADKVYSSGLMENFDDNGSHLPVVKSTTAPDFRETQRTTKSEEAIIFDESLFTFDEETKLEEQLALANTFNNSCLSNCPQGGFVLTTNPARLVTEETNGTVHLKCQAQFKNEGSNELQVTFEWLYRMPGGKPCSLGPSTNHNRCDSRLFKFSTDESTQERTFVSNLHLSALTKNHSGILDCFFVAFCCSINDGQNVGVIKIEATSELVVYERPDYTLPLSLIAAITAILCLVLTIWIFLYFRFEHKVGLNVSSREKKVVQHKQPQLATPPVLVGENFCFTEEENRVSYTSFDSTADPDETEA